MRVVLAPIVLAPLKLAPILALVAAMAPVILILVFSEYRPHLQAANQSGASERHRQFSSLGRP